jgi:hypothetical protein
MLNVLNCFPLLYHHECFRKKNTFAFNKLIKFRQLEMAFMKRSFFGCYFTQLMHVSNVCNDHIRPGFPVMHKLSRIVRLDPVYTGELMQPGQSATYLKTTAARKISTNQFRSAHTEFSLM